MSDDELLYGRAALRNVSLRTLAAAAAELEKNIPESVLATPHRTGGQVDQYSLREAASRLRRMFIAMERGER